MMLPKTMDGNFETAFPDVIKFVEHTYRVQSDKNHRAIAGLSMGGFHSLFISINNPDTSDTLVCSLQQWIDNSQVASSRSMRTVIRRLISSSVSRQSSSG